MTSTAAAANAWRTEPGNERGVALISALGALLLLTPLMLALLSMSAFESLISRNLVDASRALYAAEAGIEWGFNRLVNTRDWNVVLLGPDGIADTPDDGQPTNVPGQNTAALLVPPPDLLPWGTTMITVRNDNLVGDLAHTGQARLDDGGVPGGGKFLETNGIVIVTSTGTVNGAQRTIQATVRRDATGPGAPSGGPTAAHGVFDRHTLADWRER